MVSSVLDAVNSPSNVSTEAVGLSSHKASTFKSQVVAVISVTSFSPNAHDPSSTQASAS